MFQALCRDKLGNLNHKVSYQVLASLASSQEDLESLGQVPEFIHREQDVGLFILVLQWLYSLDSTCHIDREHLGWDYLVNCRWGCYGLSCLLHGNVNLEDDYDFKKSKKRLLVNVNIIRHNHYYLLLVYDSIILMVFILILVFIKVIRSFYE